MRSSGHLVRSGVALLCLLAGATLAAAQTPAQTPAQATPAVRLAQGWAHLGAGRVDDAIRVGEGLLTDGREPYRALALLVAAELTAGRPAAALDRYERWLTPGQPEDLYLLTEIAIGYLRRLAESTDPRVQAEARAILTRLDGPPPDIARAPQAGGALGDTALARIGDPDAISRLRARLDAPMGPEADLVISALVDANDTASIPALRRLITGDQIMAQLAAIAALGKLGDRESIPQLRDLLTVRRPLVPTTATVALARLGDPEADARLTTLLASPNGEERLMAAEAIGMAEWTRWADAITPVLDNPSLMLRVQAALLLSRAGVHVQQAQLVLAQALSDQNYILREQAAQAFTGPDQADPLLLRRLLHDDNGSVQLRGVQGFLALTRR